MSGTETVTGSKTGILTGLTLVERVVSSIDNGATATNLTVTSRVNPLLKSAVDIFVWKPTSSGDNTPIAATTAVTVHWWATGTGITTGT